MKTPTVIALGNFDGVHRGHCQVIEPILSIDAATVGVYSTVVTFSPHPQEFFTGQKRELLTPLLEKEQLLHRMGISQLIVLPFDQALASLSPQQFVEQILIAQLRPVEISVGQDFRFGQGRMGTVEELQAIAAQHSVKVHIVPLCKESGDRISSSAIRQALHEGDLARANHLLGRPYTLMGEVVHGQQLGRTLGFPTANLKLPDEKFLPRRGVYAVWVQVEEFEDAEPLHKLAGVMNIGMRPTVNGLQQTVEVHLLDWSGDLYGKNLSVSLEQFLRPEQKFASLEDLKNQIQKDSDVARSLLMVPQI